MDSNSKTNNNFLLNLHPSRQASFSEGGNNKNSTSSPVITPASNINLQKHANANPASTSNKNIFTTLGRSHSSSIINSTTSAINKNISLLLSGSNSHSTTSLQSGSQTTKTPSYSAVATNPSYNPINAPEPNSYTNGNGTVPRERAMVGGPLTSSSAVQTTSSKKKQHYANKAALNVASIFKRTEVIGRGKFGVVYKGYHIKTKHIYAIKVLNLDTNEDEIEDVQKEIKFLSSSKNIPNVTKYYGSYLNDTKLWIIMEYCAGGSLRTLLRAGVLDDKAIGVIFRELLFALSAIHKDKVIHRDIKAANILIGHDGKVKLCDFGVAAKLTQTRPRRQSLAGTPFWMAPEVITESASYDSKADIWSLGITVYEAATGNPPYCEVDAMRAMQMIVKNKPSRLEGKQYSQSLKDFVALCLDENPYERPTADILLKSVFISQYSSVKVIFLKELIIRYHNYKVKNKNNLSSVDNEPSSLNKEEVEQKIKSVKLVTEKNSNNNEIKLSRNAGEKIISSSNAVNIPSTPMPLAPSMGERTFSDAFGAAYSKKILKESLKPSKKGVSNFENENLNLKENDNTEQTDAMEEEGIEWDFDTTDKVEIRYERTIKSPFMKLPKDAYKADLNEEFYCEEDKNQDQYNYEDERQNTTNHLGTTMGRQFPYFHTQSGAPASMINSYHPAQTNTINKSYKMFQNTINTNNVKYLNTSNYHNTNKATGNQNINNNVQGTMLTGKNMSVKTDNNNKFTNTRVVSLNSRVDFSESSYGSKAINDAPEPPKSLIKLFDGLDSRHPADLELPLLTPTPMQEHYGNEPKSYFESMPNSSRTENYAMYMLKNKKYLQDGKSGSNLSLNTDNIGTPLSETNVIEIEIPDELPVVTTPSMASIPTQIKSRSRSSTLNAVLTKNANTVANNLDIHRRGTISTGYLKTPIISTNQANDGQSNNHDEQFMKEQTPSKQANIILSGSRLSPVKFDLKVNTSSSGVMHNPLEFLEEGVTKRSPQLQGRAVSPSQKKSFSSEPLSAMTPSASFIPSPKRKRNLSSTGGQSKPILADSKNNADIMNLLLQPYNDVNATDEGAETGTKSVPVEGNKRLIRDFKRHNADLKLEMPLPNNNLSAQHEPNSVPPLSVAMNDASIEELHAANQQNGAVNQFGFDTKTTNNIAIAMTPLAEKNMIFSSQDIKKSEENNLSGILEEHDSDEVIKLVTPAPTPGLVTNQEYSTVNEQTGHSNAAEEIKGSDANYFGIVSATSINNMNKLESGIKNARNAINADDLKNNLESSALNLPAMIGASSERKLSNVIAGTTFSHASTSSNNIVGSNTFSPLAKMFDGKGLTDSQFDAEGLQPSTSPIGIMSNSPAQPLDFDANENSVQTNKHTHMDNNTANASLTSNIINPRISSRVRSLSIANSSSTVSTPKVDEFAEMRILLLDYPALKENESAPTKSIVVENPDTIFVEETEFEIELDNNEKLNNGNDSDDVEDVNVTDLKDFLEEERDHYYYYALEQEQREMLMYDLKTLICDYEKSFNLLENEFKIFDMSLE
ncbi:hypothetical protein QEN19_002210 [Hanseniaspora menglaensis]